jgi:hypothetical protein
MENACRYVPTECRTRDYQAFKLVGKAGFAPASAEHALLVSIFPPGENRIHPGFDPMLFLDISLESVTRHSPISMNFGNSYRESVICQWGKLFCFHFQIFGGDEAIPSLNSEFYG